MKLLYNSITFTMSNSEESNKCLRSFANAQDDSLKVTY